MMCTAWKRLGWLFLAVCGLSLTGCAPTASPFNANSETPVFLPPTSVQFAEVTASPRDTAAVEVDPSTLNVRCTDNLTFLDDITIPDGTVVAPESTMDKRWEVENSGACNWGENYRLRLIAGPDMGVKPELALYPARSGSRAVIRIVFKAPTDDGNYRSAWQAVNPQGELFGDPFFIDIVVESQ